ncbi:trypsin-like cysteine/serine peptidase domain-containing protein [Podospora aff. communis PSN243]|uniref:Serine protease n=1 Tax=Podospora aff. communis PSN243 TaxID=3040156 RepID=A0AAV9G775_9PEZI|nr:trypsin-like cysteine/serine peptidase domain-containing protein [Podospora aff. communis PSN243]
MGITSSRPTESTLTNTDEHIAFDGPGFLRLLGNESTDPQIYDVVRNWLEVADKRRHKAVGFFLGSASCNDDAICSEALLEVSPRTEVSVDEMRPNGPLRGIVKLIVTRNDCSRIVGTGVLIRPDVIAAAGHLLENKGLYAVKVTAHAGYGSESVQTRRGRCAVVHYEWYHRQHPSNDLAFVRLESEFKHITPIPFLQTPISDGALTGRVYGYSGDIPVRAPGQRLTVSSSSFHYDTRDASGLGVLQHRADTRGGASGGPVLDDNNNLIGIHTGWTRATGHRKVNIAVTVERQGNEFLKFLEVLDFMEIEESRRRRSLPGFVVPWTTVTIGRGLAPTVTVTNLKKLESARWKGNNGCVYGW